MEYLHRRIVELKSDAVKPTTLPSFVCDSCLEDPVTSCDEEMLIEGREWAWDKTVTTAATLLSKQNREVRFHPGYSSGTAAVRGDAAFLHGRIYYWEIKMLTALYGTDVMVGIGTKNAKLDKFAYQFCSLLGSDKESWGFSYTGKLQHNGKSHFYGPPFGKGSVVGIYLDMWKGTLEFFVNRRPLGVAFKNLQGLQLYPMVCSTAAQSAMRIIVAVSQPVDLKLLSLRLLSTDNEIMQTLIRVPGIRRYLISMWWILSGELRNICGNMQSPEFENESTKYQVLSASNTTVWPVIIS
uniref:B30.2/SPRY domain-containing protein n=1 Tax=Clastoptera arizonana TaxID=38151 RepID=A0A1B6C1E4_9HEMI